MQQANYEGLIPPELRAIISAFFIIFLIAFQVDYTMNEFAYWIFQNKVYLIILFVWAFVLSVVEMLYYEKEE